MSVSGKMKKKPKYGKRRTLNRKEQFKAKTVVAAALPCNGIV